MIAVIDTETTGTDHVQDTIVEWAAVWVDEHERRMVHSASSLVNPGRPMPPQARAVHHISDDDVADALTREEALRPLLSMPFSTPAAHSAEFDAGFLPEIPGPWICTWRCAKHVWPDAPAYGNQVLRYWLPGLDERVHSELGGQPPHRALADALVTAHVLIRMLETGRSAQDLLELTKAPVLLKTCTFGKHRGTPWEEVPQDYMRWILRQQDFDPDVVHTCKTLLGPR